MDHEVRDPRTVTQGRFSQTKILGLKYRKIFIGEWINSFRGRFIINVVVVTITDDRS